MRAHRRDAGTSRCSPLGSAPALAHCRRDALGVSISTSGTNDLIALQQALGADLDGVKLDLDCAASEYSGAEGQSLVCALPWTSFDDDAGVALDASTTIGDASSSPDGGDAGP